ncbi:hypothetical protein O9X98_05460 [Agrobacterium salinitolerans]|nr:hypothetical protein [Agrobacterium salinitolerans]
MEDIDRKMAMLRERVASLAVKPETIEAAERIVKANRMVVKIVDPLRKEWLNDMITHPNAGEFRLAATDPDAHFLKWIEVRSQHPYHVTRRTVAAVGEKYGTDTATKLSIVVWPQEIAWAQRMRLDSNPFTATKAALFLRETVGNPSKTFAAISDMYTEAVKLVGYLDNPVQDMSAMEIRNASELPEFAPLFQRYAARAYAETLKDMTRDQVEKLAQRAAAEENEERRLVMAVGIARGAVRSPMRRSASTIRTAISFKLDANSTYLLETAFIRKVEAGQVEIDPGQRTADAGFLRLIADREQRTTLLNMEALPSPAEYMDTWEIAHLNATFLDQLPPSYKPLGCTKAQLESWQEAVVMGRRPCPYDAVSDLGFFLLGA